MSVEASYLAADYWHPLGARASADARRHVVRISSRSPSTQSAHFRLTVASIAKIREWRLFERLALADHHEARFPAFSFSCK